MVNIDKRARRSSHSPEPRPENISDSLTPQIGEDRNQSLNILDRHYICVLPPSAAKLPRRNEQEVSSDSDDSSGPITCTGLDFEVGSSPEPTNYEDGLWCKALKRPASFGKGKEIFAEYKEKFRALHEEMLNHNLLVENLNLPNRVRCADRARDEAYQIVIKALKEEQNYESILRTEVGGAREYMQFIGFEMMETRGCARQIFFRLPKDEEPPKDEGDDTKI